MGKINLTLVALVVALAGALGLLGKVAWDKRELNHVNSALNEQLMEARLEIGRAHTQFGDAQKYAKDLEKALEEEISNRNAEITRYGELLAKYNTLKQHKGKTKIVYVEGSETKDKFETGHWYVARDEKTLLEMEGLRGPYSDHRIDALCQFSPGDVDAAAFNFEYNLHLKFSGQLVETITPSGAINHYFNMWELDEKGKRVEKLTIADYSVVINDQRAPKFYWWAPHLDVGLVMGVDLSPKFRTGGTIGVSAMGYGLTENDLSWRFLRVGMDLAASPGVSFDPAMYNLGEHIPLISNLWVSPHVVYMFKGQWMLGFMVGAVL